MKLTVEALAVSNIDNQYFVPLRSINNCFMPYLICLKLILIKNKKKEITLITQSVNCYYFDQERNIYRHFMILP